jgi:hypothetical protein
MRRNRPRVGAVVLLALAGVVSSTFARAEGRADEKQACASAAEEAEQLRIDARLLAARERLLQCSRPECPAAVRTDCAQWMTEVAAAMPTVVFAVRDAAGRDLLRARVSVDGVLVPHGLDGKPVEVDPGVHAFRFESDGAASEQTVLVREGEKNRAITTTLDTATVAPAPPAATSSSVPPAASSPRPSAWTWVLGGVGLVAVGVGAYLELWVNAQASDLRSTCGHSCSHAQVDPLVIKQQVLGPVAFGVGALSLGLATYTLFAGPSQGGAVAGVGGRF